MNTEGATGTTPLDFIKLVVAWPEDGGPGYVNLHYKSPDGHGYPGWAYRSPEDLCKRAAWMATQPARYPDVFFCVASQTAFKKTSKSGNLQAVRSQHTAHRQKSLYADLDVKEGAYASLAECYADLTRFVKMVGLRPPSALVESGSGVHVYWASNRPLTVEEWRPYAEGLKSELLRFGIKCDAAVTTDVVRILRFPGTINCKTNPPRPVVVRHVGQTYDFATSLGRLREIGAASPVVARQSHGVPGTGGYAAGEHIVVPEALRAIPYNGSLGAGLEPHHDNRPLDPAEVIKDCPHFRETAQNHGVGYPQGLWMLDVLAATFFKDGQLWAHHFSKGYAAYSVEQTDAMWERKTNEKEKRGLGWPSCGAIEAAGCKACGACPFKGKIKSPLNLASKVQPDPANVVEADTTDVTIDRSQVANPIFRDFNQSGLPKPSLANAVIAIRALGINAGHDLFRHRINVIYKGKAQTIREGLLTDDTMSAVRSLINNTFQIDCGEANTLAAIREIAQENAFDPVLDMLDECQGKWDGVKRLDSWVIDYLGCEDTPLNRTIGQKVLIAAVHRARVSGCKFDTITVLEGVEGTNKSTAIRVLAGDENFSDQSILGAKDKEVQEQLDGIWMHENADLAGMKKAEVENVKAFASRQVDRARPAYGRVREDRPRRSIEWGTTNNDQYLLSQTGNRRFWPLKTGKIDIEALKRDREQLLGEAANREAAGESITLDPALWGDARSAQEQRRVPDPWEDTVAHIPDTYVHRAGDGYERVATADLLEHVLNIPKAQQTPANAQRLARAMERAGWGRNSSCKVTIKGVPVRGYIRPYYGLTGPNGATALQGITGAHSVPILSGPIGATGTQVGAAAASGMTGLSGPAGFLQWTPGGIVLRGSAGAD